MSCHSNPRSDPSCMLAYTGTRTPCMMHAYAACIIMHAPTVPSYDIAIATNGCVA